MVMACPLCTSRYLSKRSIKPCRIILKGLMIDEETREPCLECDGTQPQPLSMTQQDAFLNASGVVHRMAARIHFVKRATGRLCQPMAMVPGHPPDSVQKRLALMVGTRPFSPLTTGN